MHAGRRRRVRDPDTRRATSDTTRQVVQAEIELALREEQYAEAEREAQRLAQEATDRYA